MKALLIVQRVLVAVGALMLVFVAMAGLGLLGFSQATGFPWTRTEFDLVRATSVVEWIRRSPPEDFDPFGSVISLPSEFRELSVGGEILVGRDDSKRYLFVKFWERRAINSFDGYVYKVGSPIGYEDAGAITRIARNWYYVVAG